MLSEHARKYLRGKPSGFEKKTTWVAMVDCIDYEIDVYGKSSGRPNSENKYEFPPPIDKLLFFGSVAVIAKKKTLNTYVDLTPSLWNNIYQEKKNSQITGF